MATKKALITGITGQDGAYLSRLLLHEGYTVIGLTRDAAGGNVRNLRYLGVDEHVDLVETDLLDLSNIIRIIEKYGPDEVYNLAAQSSVGLSFDQPIGTLEFNIIGTANLLEAIRITKSKARFYQASSSEMFGKVEEENLPVTEDFRLHPVSPYGISKASAHWTAINYREAYGLFVVCGILFNHESTLRPKNFVTKKILNTAVRIQSGSADRLTLGNLDVRRDWGYAPEYVRAMWLMLQQKTADDYVIASGESHTLMEFAEKVFQHVDLPIEKYLTVDQTLFRPMELKSIHGDSSKARSMLDWDYSITFDQLIVTLVQDEIRYYEWEQVHG